MMDDYEIGWWRHSSHRRKVAAANGFTIAKAIARVRRRRILDNVVSTSVGLLVASLVLVVVFGMVVVCSR